MKAQGPSRAQLRSLTEVLERGVQLRHDGPAIREGNREIGYGELGDLTARLATKLVGHGIQPGDRVAIWLPKSIEAIASMQAALRIGAVYVPVDPLSPTERVRRILDDCRPAACVALAAGAEELLGGDLSNLTLLTMSVPGEELEVLAPGGIGDPPAAPSAPKTVPAIGPEPNPSEVPAYILYTSGSTGRPKGVCISHRNALAFIEWAHAEISARPSDRFASHAPLHFDLSVLDIYVAFLAGACVCLISEATSFAPGGLVEFISGERITVWYSVPSALMLMERAGLLEDPPVDLRVVLFAGEPFPIEPLRRLRRGLPGVRLFNLYGPTETNVCTFYEVEEIEEGADRPVPIGRACCGDEVWIEDEQGPLPVGARGELVVAGPTVMLGYWGAAPQRGPYRTGDLAERVSEHHYRYVGRRDSMVKVRGHRVELGEVETAIANHPDVLEAAVLVLGEGLDSQLVAAVAPRSDGTPDLLEIKRWCAARLPRYMIVQRMRALSALPRTRNGKVDRSRLDALFSEDRTAG